VWEESSVTPTKFHENIYEDTTVDPCMSTKYFSPPQAADVKEVFYAQRL